MYFYILLKFRVFNLDRRYVISIGVTFALRCVDINNIKNRGEEFVYFIKSSNSATQRRR